MRVEDAIHYEDRTEILLDEWPAQGLNIGDFMRVERGTLFRVLDTCEPERRVWVRECGWMDPDDG